jgi:hypothetical protein
MPALPVVSDLMDAIMNELRIPVTNLIERTKIQTQMSYVYGDICAKQDWWWLVKKYPYTLSGDDFVTANPGITLTLTYLTAVATLSSAPIGDIRKRAIWFFNGERSAQDVYRVASSSVSGSTTVDLDSIYGGATATNISFKTAMDQVFIVPSDVAKVLRMTRYGSRSDMRKIGIEEMSQIKQYDKSFGPPQLWSIYDHQTTGDPSTDRIIWVHPYPDAFYRIELWYKHQQAGDLSDLALPVDYQQALNYGTLSRCYPIFMNDLDRGSYYLNLFNDVMALMAAQQREYASDHPGIQPQADLYRTSIRSSRRRWPYSLGDRFDTWPNIP